MTRDKALETLKALKDIGDPEVAHLDADDILCSVLIDLGYEDVVEAYGAVPKWYA